MNNGFSCYCSHMQTSALQRVKSQPSLIRVRKNFFSAYFKKEKTKLQPWLLPDTDHRQPLVLATFLCMTSLCYFFISQSKGGICLSQQPWTEYCRALQFHTLTTDKSFCLAGHESSRGWVATQRGTVAPDVKEAAPFEIRDAPALLVNSFLWGAIRVD